VSSSRWGSRYLCLAVGLCLGICISGRGVGLKSALADDDAGSFSFKLPEQTKKDDPAEEKGSAEVESGEITPSSFRLDVEFPRYRAFVALNPGYIGLSQSLQVGSAVASKLNVAEYIPIAFQAGASAEFTPRILVEAKVAFARFNTAQQNLSLFSIQSSSATIISANLTGFYCFFIGATGLKICPGVGAGIDGFPIFRFEDNTHLVIGSFTDMLVKATARIARPIGTQAAVWLEGGYDLGFGKGASNGISTKSDRSLWSSIGLSAPVSIKMDFQVAFTLTNKSSSFVQDQDTWDAAGNVFSLSLGAAYRL
jgi:hypothetical protein